MTLGEQEKKCQPLFCKFCGTELKNGKCFCYNSMNEKAQYDEYTGVPLQCDQ